MAPPIWYAEVVWFALAIACQNVPIEVTRREGPRPNQVQFDVKLSPPAALVTLCTRENDPGEQILVESPHGRDHEVRISGLLPGHAYACEIAAHPADASPRSVIERVVAGPSPLPFTPLQVEIDPALGMTGEWTLMGRPTDGTDDSWIVIFDAEGRPRWWEQLPQYLHAIEVLHHPADDVVVWGGGAGRAGPGAGRPAVVPIWDGTHRIDVLDWRDTKFSHDGVRLPDGRFLTLEVVSNEGPDERVWNGFRARVYDPATDTIDFAFDSQRYVDEGILHLPEPGDDGPYHANWVHYAETPAGPELYVSLCNAEQILAIDGIDGSLRWQLGAGLGWTVLDESGAEVGDAILPRCQHGVEVEGNEILVYDNGRGRDQSSASRWRMNAAEHTVQRLWYWTEEGWSLSRLGDIDALAPDRVLVTMARFGPDRNGNTELVEVDVPTGRVASRQWFEEHGRGYRAERLEGCAVFDRADRCPALAERLAELTDRLGLGSL